MKAIAKIISKLAFISAKVAAGSASQWLTYQPKEPKDIKKRLLH